MTDQTTPAGPARRTLLTAAAGAGIATGVAALSAPDSAMAAGPATARPRPTIVLVHGAWSDGSAWAGVIEELQGRGHAVVAAQLALQSIAADAAIVTRLIDDTGGPVVLAGHSYGGAVISLAASGRTDVRALVYVAAFAPDTGESLGQLVGGYPPPPVLSKIVAGSTGQLIIDRAAFPAVFAPDLPARQARVLAATQGPLAAATFSETFTVVPAWRQVPCWYQVSADDQVISPDLERFLAHRMNARTVTLTASHAALRSRPQAVASLIAEAARASI